MLFCLNQCTAMWFPCIICIEICVAACLIVG